MTLGQPCALCELVCGRQLVERAFDGRRMAFCCMGCANVYAILSESGVIAAGQNLRETEIYRRSLELGLVSNPDVGSESAPLIDPAAPTEEMLVQVGGMWCSACGCC